MIFLLFKDNLYPSYITYSNNSQVEIYVHDPDPSNTDVTVSCEDTMDFPGVCDIFRPSKNVLRSSRNNWYGTIQVLKKLNYLTKSIYQFILVAKVKYFFFFYILW